MGSVLDSLRHWARKTTTSFAELGLLYAPREDAPAVEKDGLIYRLRQWPHLTPSQKTVDVLRTLSVMSSRPVNRHWILSKSGLPAREVDRLLSSLVARGDVEVIDPRRFAPSQ